MNPLTAKVTYIGQVRDILGQNPATKRITGRNLELLVEKLADSAEGVFAAEGVIMPVAQSPKPASLREEIAKTPLSTYLIRHGVPSPQAFHVQKLLKGSTQIRGLIPVKDDGDSHLTVGDVVKYLSDPNSTLEGIPDFGRRSQFYLLGALNREPAVTDALPQKYARLSENVAKTPLPDYLISHGLTSARANRLHNALARNKQIHDMVPIKDNRDVITVGAMVKYLSVPNSTLKGIRNFGSQPQLLLLGALYREPAVYNALLPENARPAPSSDGNPLNSRLYVYLSSTDLGPARAARTVINICEDLRPGITGEPIDLTVGRLLQAVTDRRYTLGKYLTETFKSDPAIAKHMPLSYQIQPSARLEH